MDVEQIRRLVDENLPDPRSHHQQRLERFGRQRLDHERRRIVLDAIAPAHRSAAVSGGAGGRRSGRERGSAQGPPPGQVADGGVERLVQRSHLPLVTASIGMRFEGQPPSRRPDLVDRHVSRETQYRERVRHGSGRHG